MLSLTAGAAAAAVSVTEGFSGGRAAACFTSGFDTLGIEGSVRLASITFGFAGTGCADAVVSAETRPTLRARLLKNPSDWAFGAADATRVAGAGAAGAGAAGVIEANSGSGEVTGPRGGLTVEGMVPGARESASSDRP